MKLKNHYNQLWAKSVEKFNKGEFRLDTQIDNKSDTRYGLTLLARPSIEVKNRISKALKVIRPFAPQQYYYPISDIHVTILSIISCQPDFSLDEIDTSQYVKLIETALAPIAPFEITFTGLTASSSALMICGFPESDELNKIRNRIRNAFKQNLLYQTIDERYSLQTAHATVIRFRKQFSNPEAFIQKIKTLKNMHFGTCTMDTLELVGNDWYQRQDKTKGVKKFTL